MVIYVGPLAVYKIIDPHNYLLMTLDGTLLQGLFEHERIKPAAIRTSEGNITNLKTSNFSRNDCIEKVLRLKKQDVTKKCRCQGNR